MNIPNLDRLKPFFSCVYGLGLLTAIVTCAMYDAEFIAFCLVWVLWFSAL